MIMVENPEKGIYKHTHIGKEQILYNDVGFQIEIPNCDTVPSSIDVQWEFGDSSTTQIERLRSFQKIHRYVDRGEYHFAFKFKDAAAYEVTKTGVIYIGIASSFQVSPLNVTIGQGTSFTITPHGGLAGSMYNYDFYLRPNEGWDSTLTTTQLPGFSSPGLYLPYVVARLESVDGPTELLYSTIPLAVDYDINTVGMALSIGQNPVYLPTGYNYLQISKTSAPSFKMTCHVKTGDKVNRTAFSVEQSFFSVWKIDYYHFSLGTMTASVHCFNRISEFKKSLSFEVVNPCFRIDGRFDRTFSMPDTPLVVLTTEDVLLYARSTAICNSMLNILWKVEHVENLNSYYNYTDIGFINKANTSTNVLYIPKNVMTPGLYKITANVSLNNTYLDEYTFLQFHLPPPRAFIKWGSLVKAKEKKNYKIELNAIDVSYQQQLGDGGSLQYSWTCNRLFIQIS